MERERAREKEREGGGEGTSQDAWYGQHRLSCDGTAGRHTAEHRSELIFNVPLPEILVAHCPRGRTPLEDCWNRTVSHVFVILFGVAYGLVLAA
jgi:hypothetical protein